MIINRFLSILDVTLILFKSQKLAVDFFNHRKQKFGLQVVMIRDESLQFSSKDLGCVHDMRAFRKMSIYQEPDDCFSGRLADAAYELNNHCITPCYGSIKEKTERF